MATKTIFIEDPEDYQEGDYFRGTIVRDAITLRVEGPLRMSNPNLTLTGVPRPYVLSNLPYVDLGKWTDVQVTREVEIPSEYLDFEVGALVQHRTGNRYIRTPYGWTGVDSGNTFTVNEMDATIQYRRYYEEYYTLLHGPEPKGRPE